jgi:ribokinase
VAIVDHFDVVVVGGANMDYLAKGRTLPAPGSTVEGFAFQEAPGGKGANQAVAAARLGARVAFVGGVGSDARGLAIAKRLADEGVDTRALKQNGAAETGVALVMVDDKGEKQILTAPGANKMMSPADVEEACSLIANAKVLLVQLELPLETVAAAIHYARAAGAHVVLDPAPPVPLSEELLSYVHVLRPNAHEAEALTGIVVCDRASARQAAENLMHRGLTSVCIGAPCGDLTLCSDGELWLPHLPVEAVDATGAGDAFAAGLAVALAEGQSLFGAARLARAASACAITKLGAQAGLPFRRDAEKILRRFDQELQHPL